MADVARHPEFPIDEWEKAPHYWGPGTQELQDYGRITVLDFERLTMLAEMQRDRGAFTPDNNKDAQKAPVKVGGIPGSFVSVESLWEEDYFLHHPSEPEIFVVIKGILEVERSQHANGSRVNIPPKGIFRQGDVVALRPGELQLTAHGLDKRASSLALSILGLFTRQGHLFVAQSCSSGPKEFDEGFKPVLPYDPKRKPNG